MSNFSSAHPLVRRSSSFHLPILIASRLDFDVDHCHRVSIMETPTSYLKPTPLVRETDETLLYQESSLNYQMEESVTLIISCINMPHMRLLSIIRQYSPGLDSRMRNAMDRLDEIQSHLGSRRPASRHSNELLREHTADIGTEFFRSPLGRAQSGKESLVKRALLQESDAKRLECPFI